MKKLKEYLYSVLFWLSRFITIFLFGICFFVVLNAKYVFSETFFSFLFTALEIKLMSIINFFVFLDNNAFEMQENIKHYLYCNFCVKSQGIDTILYAFLFILLIYCMTKYIIKNREITILTILEIVSVYFFIYLFTTNLNFLILSLISSIIFIAISLISPRIKKQKVLMAFPIIGEIFCINGIVSFITKREIKKTNFFILVISLLISNIIYMLLPYCDINSNFKIRNDDIYNIVFDSNKNRYLISSRPIIIYDFDSNNQMNFDMNFAHYQDVQVNWDKEEFYLYNSLEYVLYIVDIKDKKVKSKIKILTSPDENISVSARLIYDDKNDLLLLVFEKKYGAVLINLKNLKIVKEYNNDLLFANDSGIYNKFRDSFILTFFKYNNVVQEIRRKCDEITNIPIGSEQGYIVISEQNKEVYIAFHQQGRIGVYDAKTMELKRKIKTNYAVKDITYDEDLNILIAPSYFNGYIDLFLMDGSDKLLIRKFVGYELRQAKFDTKKENLYVCSRKGLYKVPVDIKESINKHKNVSHETKNGNL